MIALDVAGEPVAQDKLEINRHVTTSPFVNVELEYEELFVPTLEPLTNH